MYLQIMLQDFVRIGTCCVAKAENHINCLTSTMIFVAAVRGILSLIVVQVGARHVSTIEASQIVAYAQKLIAENSPVKQHLPLLKKAEILKISSMAAVISQSLVYQSFPMLKFLGFQLDVSSHMSLSIAPVASLLIVAGYNNELGFHFNLSTVGCCHH
ncbi:putative histone-arginine methyltransferase 1.3 [Nicotiana attenuata]|uniref:Histone-arginine methyltransferase 1.3 n=1 Tax=Nicotiana attenuata TaxID=49451 RepID=A0A314KPS3_NICAT|nr:putative histone-arginine methyltransferase 1.3 [Nicotiana attenuata]